jgi:hypothetical protein
VKGFRHSKDSPRRDERAVDDAVPPPEPLLLGERGEVQSAGFARFIVVHYLANGIWIVNQALGQ